MRTSQKGFTLVELIVVITILAILGTIAFISLQGYSQDAKNSKVTSDLRTIASAIETSLTKGNVTLANLVVTSTGSTTNHAVAGTFGSLSFSTGSTGTPPTPILNPTTIDATATTGNYAVGTINFVSLRQNADDFVDPDNREYLVGRVASGNVGYYQLVGQVRLNSGDFEVVTSGNYVQEDPTPITGDVAGLISRNATTQTNDALIRGQTITSAALPVNTGINAPERN